MYSLTALTPLLDRGEVLIIALGEVDHHVLAALGQLPHTPARRPRIPEKKNFVCTCLVTNIISPAECRYNRFWRQDSAVLYVAAVSDGAAPSNYTVLPWNIYVGGHSSKVNLPM